MSGNPLDRDRDGRLDVTESVDRALDRDQDGTMDIREGGHEHRHTHADGTAHTHAHQEGAHHGAEGQALSGRGTGEIAVPVAEERLNVEKRQAQVGEVEIRKTVEQEQVQVPVELMHEEVRVQQRDLDDRPAQAGDNLFQEGTIRVPVRGEEAVVTKEAVVTGEVVIDKERLTERQTVTDTVRRERVEVDRDYDQHRSAYQESFNRTRGANSTRTFEDAEPNYQYGYSAARNEQYSGRAFEDVEPDLRRDYEERYSSSGSGDSWENLRQEIREGYNRVRR